MSATWAQCWTRFAESVKLAEGPRRSLTIHFTNTAPEYVATEAAILADGIPLDVFNADAYGQGLRSIRAKVGDILTSFAPPLAAVFVELSRVAGRPETDPETIIPVLYEYMAENQGAFASAPRVASRLITRGTPTYGNFNNGGTSIGNGTLYRLLVDRYSFPLEGDTTETLLMRCRFDAQTGTKVGQEQFEVEGLPFRDALTWYSGTGVANPYGSGLKLAAGSGVQGVTGDDTQSLVQNPSFADFSGTAGAADFALTGWTQTAGLAASMSVDTVNFYRACSIETTPGALKCTASVTITQTLASRAGALQVFAYMSRLAVNFSQWGGTGSVTVQIGSKSWTVNSGVAGWNLLVPPQDKNLWLPNFNTAGLAVTITVTRTGGTAILVDDFLWSPFTNVAGKLFWLAGGATAFRIDDTITVTDSEPGNGTAAPPTYPSQIQNWIRILFPGHFLPSAPDCTNVANVLNPSDSAAAGVVTAGTHFFGLTVVDYAGQESSVINVSSLIAAGGKQVQFASGPALPSWASKFKVYMTTVADAATFRDTNVSFTVAPPGNVNVSDATLAGRAASPAGITIADPLPS